MRLSKDWKKHDFKSDISMSLIGKRQAYDFET